MADHVEMRERFLGAGFLSDRICEGRPSCKVCGAVMQGNKCLSCGTEGAPMANEPNREAYDKLVEHGGACGNELAESGYEPSVDYVGILRQYPIKPTPEAEAVRLLTEQELDDALSHPNGEGRRLIRGHIATLRAELAKLNAEMEREVDFQAKWMAAERQLAREKAAREAAEGRLKPSTPWPLRAPENLQPYTWPTDDPPKEKPMIDAVLMLCGFGLGWLCCWLLVRMKVIA